MSDVQTDAAFTSAAVSPRPEIRTLAVTGPDRVEFLSGMLTNDVRALTPGQGQRSVKVNNKGRIEAYVRVRATETSFEIDVLDVVADRLARTLESFIIMEDCAVVDVSSTRDVLTVLGPDAGAVLEKAGFDDALNGLSDHAFLRTGEVTVIRDRTLGVPGYELHLSVGEGQAKLEALLAAGARRIDHDSLEVVRIEAGEPQDGSELDLETFPMEAGLQAAISMTKGCYVGQEVIARGTNLGQVNYQLVGWRLLEDEAPEETAAEVLGEDGKRMGELCSLVWSEHAKAWIGLGYARREQAQAGTEGTIVLGGRARRIVVSARPFRTL